MHENVLDVAETLPARLEPTGLIHSLYQEVIDGYVEQVAGEKLDWAFLAVNEEEERFLEGWVDQAADLIPAIGEFLVQGFVIVAVVVHGRLLTADETDSLRDQAIQQLPPISRAKAEGRFQDALAAMGGGLL